MAVAASAVEALRGISTTLEQHASALRNIDGDLRQANETARSAPRWTIDKVLPIVFSGFALAVSLFFAAYTAIYTRRKDARARTQSISDEYLLRKIVSPVVVEPLIKWILEVTAAIPPDCADTEFSEAGSRAYQVIFQKAMVAHRGNLVMLEQLDGKLFAAANQRLDTIEDGVLVYCDANAGRELNPDASAKYPRAPLLTDIRTNMRAILGDVVAYQKSLS